MDIGERARPFMTFHVGQAGVQIGSAIWELLCLEHNINVDGTAKAECPSNGLYDAAFLKSSAGHFMPRSIFLDTDPTCIDEVRTGPYRELFSTNQLLSDQTDAGGNYMRGRHGYASRLVPNTVERFRWLMEKTDVTPAVFLVNGLGGGTGTGLAVSCLESLHNEFGSSLQVFDINVSTGRSGMQSSCEAVNSVLYQFESRDYTSMSFSVTNSAMYNICRSGLNLPNATYAHTNRMLAMCFSNLTSLERFPGTIPCRLSVIQNNVLPFKGLKHLLLACAPFPAAGMASKERLSAVGITSDVMEPDSQLADVDLRRGKHLAGVLLYRGAAKPSDVDQAVTSIRAKGRIEFADWAPAAFKTGLLGLPPLAVPSSGIDSAPLSVTLVSNHSAVATLFRGQSDAVKKLKHGSYFLYNYETTAGATAGAGHNSSISNLLKEACDHVDGLTEFYEKEQPPQEPGRLSQTQNRQSRPTNKRSNVQNSEQAVERQQASELKSAPGDKQRDIEDLVVALNVKDSASTQQEGELVSIDYTQTDDGENVHSVSESVQLESTPVATAVQLESTSVDEGVQRKSTSVAEDVQHESTPVAEDLQRKSTSVAEDVQRKSTSAAEDVQRKSTSVAEDVQRESTSVAEDVHHSGTMASQSPDHSQATSRGSSVQKRSTSKQKKSCSKCCDKSEKRSSKKDKNLQEGPVQETQPGDGKRKRSSSKCCDNSEKRSSMKDKNLQKGQAQKEEQGAGEQKRKSRGSSGCRKRSSDRTDKKKRSGSRTREPNVEAVPAYPKQAQNHASSAIRHLTTDTTSSDSDSSRSVQRLEGYSYSNYQSNTVSQLKGQRLHNGSSISTNSTADVVGISGIIQSCLHDHTPTSNTIDNVKQIIQKYNNIFAKEA